MYINYISIIYYLIAGILGLIAGQFVEFNNIRLLNNKNEISGKNALKQYISYMKIKYPYMIIMALLYIAILYVYGINVKAISYFILLPFLMSVFIIDYKERIIPNRLSLTIFEVGLVFTFIQGVININIAIDMLLGMCVGTGIFLIITLIGGLIAGKEAMGFGDVKLMGALGLFFGWRAIIIISLFLVLVTFL